MKSPSPNDGLLPIPFLKVFTTNPEIKAIAFLVFPMAGYGKDIPLLLHSTVFDRVPILGQTVESVSPPFNTESVSEP